MYKIVAIVVTFNPELESLNSLLKAIEPQVDHIFIIDNGSLPEKNLFIRKLVQNKVRLVELDDNYGISKAINIGIDESRMLKASHILCFDQDSLPMLDMVEKLLSAMNQKMIEDIKVAAVGPNYFDFKGNQAVPFVKLTGKNLHRVECSGNDVVIVDHLITSGCLISMDALNDIGGMEPRLFIDYVDTEWCLRAVNKGYYLFGVGAAKMQHNLGDELVEFLGRSIIVHSPLRNYYLIRNGLWLIFQPWVSFDWKMMDLKRLIKIYLLFSFFAGNKIQNLTMMTKGIFHAVKGKMGKYQN